MAEESVPEHTSKSDDPQRSALDKAGEFAKYLAALATGALVFSKDLLGKDFALPGDTRYFILVAWCFLSLSVVAGILALARIPMMLREGTSDLEDKYLAFPLRAQQVLFLFGRARLGGCADRHPLVEAGECGDQQARRSAEGEGYLPVSFPLSDAFRHGEQRGRALAHRRATSTHLPAQSVDWGDLGDGLPVREERAVP